MQIIKHNPAGLFPQYRCYTHAVEIRGDSRLLIISGLNGYLKDGRTMPESGDILYRSMLPIAGSEVEAGDRSHGCWLETSHFRASSRLI
jgi:hypothetical protein